MSLQVSTIFSFVIISWIFKDFTNLNFLLSLKLHFPRYKIILYFNYPYSISQNSRFKLTKIYFLSFTKVSLSKLCLFNLIMIKLFSTSILIKFHKSSRSRTWIKIHFLSSTISSNIRKQNKTTFIQTLINHSPLQLSTSHFTKFPTCETYFLSNIQNPKISEWHWTTSISGG